MIKLFSLLDLKKLRLALKIMFYFSSFSLMTSFGMNLELSFLNFFFFLIDFFFSSGFGGGVDASFDGNAVSSLCKLLNCSELFTFELLL